MRIELNRLFQTELIVVLLHDGVALASRLLDVLPRESACITAERIRCSMPDTVPQGIPIRRSGSGLSEGGSYAAVFWPSTQGGDSVS
jgi:hypothetical protein